MKKSSYLGWLELLLFVVVVFFFPFFRVVRLFINFIPLMIFHLV